MATTGGFIAELKRRNVIRMAGLYLVTAWLVVQVRATLLPVFDAPPWTMKALVMTLAVAFVPALAVAWMFELTPQGFRRDAEVPAAESIAPRTARALDRAIIVLLALALGYFGFDKFVLSPRREEALVAEATRAAAVRAAADAALQELISDYGDVAAYQVAQVQALRNDADAAFEWLEKAHATRDPGIGNLLIDPLVMRYKTDPRLAAFCAKVGLPAPATSQTKGI